MELVHFRYVQWNLLNEQSCFMNIDLSLYVDLQNLSEG